MSVYSMTGYAGVQHSTADSATGAESRTLATTRLGLEIRSVNSRFLDLSFRLCDELREHEPALRELLASQLKRGKVEVRASIDAAMASPIPEPSPRMLQRLNAVQDNIRAWLPEARALSVAEVIRLCATAEGDSAADLGKELLPLAGRALEALMDARRREGARLATMLQERLAQLHALTRRAGPLIPRLVEQQQSRFLARWKDAMGLTGDGATPETAHDRALTEATAFAIRIDVAEELTRLESHLDEMGRLISQGGEVGKRLDFLIQELHREANTMGSKSATLELTRISVDMKVLIEQMREQVQNIE